MRRNLNFFIKEYLENRPLFYTLIRPQEALLFYQNKKYLKSPIVDFGCGDGFFTKIVFGKGKIDIGLDLKSSRAQEAEKEKIYKKVIYYNGKKMPFSDQKFKTVISNCVLEHIPNIDLSLKEIYRVLQPKGYFLTTVMTDNWEKNLLGTKILGKPYKLFMKKIQQHHNLLSQKQWNKKFQQAGFKVAKSTPYLAKRASNFLEILHYLSTPSLFSYFLFKKWVIFPSLHRLFLNKSLANNLLKLSSGKNNSSALFFILSK